MKKIRRLVLLQLLVCAVLLGTGCGTAKEEVSPPSAAEGKVSEPEEGAKPETPASEAQAPELPAPAPEKQQETPEQVVAETEGMRGKTVTILGDSISTYTGYIPDDYSKYYPESGDFAGVEDTWWMQVIENTGMELCANASYSGGTVSGDSGEQVDGRAAISDRRIKDLAGADGSVPDVILILVGANELLNHVPMGDYMGEGNVQEGVIENFSEAYGLMLQKIQKAYPKAEIYCCTVAEVSRWNDEGERFPFTNSQELKTSDYNERIVTIAEAMNLPVIDVYDCGITYENAKELTLDGTHPNKEGAKLIAQKVTEYFTSQP